MHTISSFYNSFKELQALIPGNVIQLNDYVKGTKGKRQEGVFSKLLDSYAKAAFQPGRESGGGKSKPIPQKKTDFDIKVWKEKVKSIIDLDNVDEVELQRILDTITNAVYGIRVGNKKVTFAEWKRLRETNPATTGDFVPTITTSNKELAKFDKTHPGTESTDEARLKKAGITDESNVYYYIVSTDGKGSLAQEDKVVRGEGPLQIALNAIAGANKKLSITTERKRIDRRTKTKHSYRAAKHVFSTTELSTAFYGAVRELLTPAVANVIMNSRISSSQ